MKNILKEIQDGISPQHIYYFYVQFDHLKLTQPLIKNSLFKDSDTKILLTKDNKLIAYTQPIHSTILGQMLLLNMVRLKFSATLFDIQRNVPIVLKIIKISNKQQQQVSDFRLVPAKYVQCYNMEGKKHFQEKFKSKLGLVIEMLVCIQKTRVKLQKIVRQAQTQKRRRRSQSAKKFRLNSPLAKNAFKLKQDLISSNLKSDLINNQEDNQEGNQTKNSKFYQQNNKKKFSQKKARKDMKRQDNISKYRKSNLKISKITEINSQQVSQISRSLSNSQIVFQSQIQRDLHEIQKNGEIDEQKIISQLSQFTSKQLQSKKISHQAPYSNIFSQDQSSNLSRSIGIVQSQSQDSTSMNSSRISNSSDLNNFHKKRNKTCYIILILIGFFLLINALRPSKKYKKVKKMF